VRFLPIVERELRVVARQPKTSWRRVLTVGAALTVFTMAFLSLDQRVSSSQLGRELTLVLSWLGFLYCLLAGPLTTVDCLGRERREGTLGLLFLTDLRGYDVVLGKMAAASLDMLLALAAALPVVAMPALMGGSSFTQFARIALGLLHIMFLSLAVGICVSSLLANGRASLGVTLVVLCFLTLGLPLFGEAVLKVSFNSAMAAWVYSVCPLWTMYCCMDFGPVGPPASYYWLSLAGLQGLTWTCLGIAALRAATSWRTPPGAPLRLQWLERFGLWGRWQDGFRLAWKRSMLERNPVAWLEGRNRLQRWLMWGLILVAYGGWTLGYVRAPQQWLDQDMLILWPMWAHYILCVWLAIQAPQRLADDKQSGALELLLGTPVQPGQIVRGCMTVLRSQFGRAVLVLLMLDLCMVGAYFGARGGWKDFVKDDVFPLSICAVLVFPFQAWSLARVGLYQGLRQANSLRATFMLLWKLGLLPWVVFVALIMLWQATRSHVRILVNIPDAYIFFGWAAVHLVACSLFLAHASWHLRRNFRRLAAQTVVPSWWKRALPFQTMRARPGHSAVRVSP
jgi:ABC-type transport system involved in cytochrome c biogenesis permease component